MADSTPAVSTRPPRTSGAGSPAPPAPRSGPLVLIVVGLGALMVSMAQGLLVPVLSVLPAELNTTASNVEWLLTSTLLVAAVAVPLLGRLGDMFGKRRLLLVAVGMLTIGSLICALTSDVAVMMVGRAIQGASAAAVPLGISLAASLLPREKAGVGIAVISAMLGVGGALSLPLAGLIADNTDYHVLFWVSAIGGAVSVVSTLVVVPEAPSRTGGRVDLVGALLLSAGLAALLLPLAEAANWGWGSARVIGLLVLSVVLLGTLVLFELRTREPLVDVVALRRRPVILTNLASVLFGFAMFASMIGTATYVQAPEASGYGFGTSMVVGGLCLLPSGLAMLFLAPVSARLVSLLGGGRTLAIGAVVVAIGWGMRMAVTDSLWQIIVGTTVVGIGTGVGYAAMPSLINTHTPPAEIAAANGLNTLARAIGSSLASAIAGAIMVADTVSLGGHELPSLTAYRELFGLCAGAAVLAALAALAIPGSLRRREPTRQAAALG
ncbi:MAG: MFS transporter [Frankia sp.]|nr:MFS transporter [Frankia sp.]